MGGGARVARLVAADDPGHARRSGTGLQDGVGDVFLAGPAEHHLVLAADRDADAVLERVPVFGRKPQRRERAGPGVRVEDLDAELVRAAVVELKQIPVAVAPAAGALEQAPGHDERAGPGPPAP